MKRMIAAAAVLAATAGVSAPAAARDGVWPRYHAVDRIEDRLDRREDRIDRRVDWGPLDRLEDRIDRWENRWDRRSGLAVTPIDRAGARWRWRRR